MLSSGTALRTTFEAITIRYNHRPVLVQATQTASGLSMAYLLQIKALIAVEKRRQSATRT